ncbi:GH36-type glycosyl hydrolase domain-containing protein [Leptospira levettii]|uniref:Cellobiose phosphorylase n=1 Tax=Leptospira levettii TaxID=2023178 RepID=A0AAW5VFB8_9LEPT|nr:cellobiose phosphorylase [Leptospira levettii]MCW7467123.1 cellobiose phosphorylase [Leptospira levettii]MCW7512845.1 cellobiose phosphorylase [Leptospira levettii]MCW7516567.1 cellobiose phosphorylase [Leptospira levettii]
MEIEYYESILKGKLMYLLHNKSGLKIKILSNLSIHSIFFNNIFVNLYFGNELETSLTNLTIEYKNNSQTSVIPLFSPFGSPKIKTSENSISIQRNIDGLEIITKLQLHETINCWRMYTQVTNLKDDSVTIRFVNTCDLGLCDVSSAKLNEAFVSQYIHHEIFDTKDFGITILSRQNESVFGKHPACLTFSDQTINSYATDGRDIFHRGKLSKFRNRRLQGEHSMVGLSTETIKIEPNQAFGCYFYSFLFENLVSIDRVPSISDTIKLCQKGWEACDLERENEGETNLSLFHLGESIDGGLVRENQLKELFTNPWRNIEFSKEGTLLSFFTEQSKHVTLKEKEILCLRPQGQILRTGNGYGPNESSLTTTCYFDGIFLSQLTQGHTSLNLLLSRKTGDLGMSVSKGLRIFCKVDSVWKRLGNPSYQTCLPDVLVWVYLLEENTIQIQVKSDLDDAISLSFIHSFGSPLEVLFSFSTGLDGENGDLALPPNIKIEKESIFITPNQKSSLYERLDGKGFRIHSDQLTRFLVSDDRLLFEKEMSLGLPYLTIKTEIQCELKFKIYGDLTDERKNKMSSVPKNTNWIEHQSLLNSAITLNDVKLLEMIDILPWYKQNAEIHFLNPRGLEQFSGGGWGTRDVCQGAFEFLLSSGNFSAIRELLLHVFCEQNEDGDWPQWFMLYERDKHIRASDSHGDILYWPIISMLTYLERSNDRSILDEITTNRSRTSKRSILKGIEITLIEIKNRFVQNTILPKYGNGDWNDSMQPKELSFQSQAVSTWTAELQNLLFQKLIWFYDWIGNETKKSEYQTLFHTLTKQIHSECMENHTLAGLVQFPPNEKNIFFLHPKDTITKIQYSILPMIYGILADVFTLEEAEYHLEIIKQHLTGPDGVRLFNKPVPYQKGNSTFFKRAETASYFGREIGLMYTHAHLRYCEALAYMGKSKEFFTQLNLTNPIGISKRISQSRLRQSNCYYSSSDACFLDREEAEKNYEMLLEGKIPLEGGWRVYSSGPGIFLKLFYESLLGIQLYHDGIIFDPIMPIELNGLQIYFERFDTKFEITYDIRSENGCIHSIQFNGMDIPIKRLLNPYRLGGFKVNQEMILKYKKEGINTFVIRIE